jgi:hypothetical protein
VRPEDGRNGQVVSKIPLNQGFRSFGALERSKLMKVLSVTRARSILSPGLLAGVAALALAVSALGSTDAQAQNRRKSRRSKVIRLGEFRIEGTIQKPQAFYILQRSNLNFEGLELKNSFVPKIIQSVDQPPF